MQKSVINSVLACLEEAASFLHLEVQVASLLGRRPSCKLRVPVKSREREAFLFVNDVYPRYEAMYFRTPQGELLSKHTPFLKRQKLLDSKKPEFMVFYGFSEQVMFERRREPLPFRFSKEESEANARIINERDAFFRSLASQASRRMITPRGESICIPALRDERDH